MPEDLRSIADIVRTHARQRPLHTALVFSGRETSYSELDERSSRAARAIADVVGPHGRIAVLDTNSDLYFELLLGRPRPVAFWCR